MVNILWVLLFKNIYPCALIRPCALIIFQTFSQPVQLLGPVRLLFLKIFPPCALIKPCSSIRHTRVSHFSQLVKGLLLSNQVT